MPAASQRDPPYSAFKLFLLCLLVSTALCDSTPALDAFFSELDNNRDGAIDASEATQFIGGSIGGQEFDEPQEAADAAASFLHNIDSGDAGITVSVDELDVHLHAVLSGVRVWEWIRHGLLLPQYASAFRQHAITPLDFPELVQNNGRVLEEELGVASQFHRSKLVRAIRRQILGLGRPPSEPRALSCSQIPNARRGRVAVHWRPPGDPGSPPLHRYVLEVAAPDGQWRTVTEVDDPEPAAVVVDLTEAAAISAGGTVSEVDQAQVPGMLQQAAAAAAAASAGYRAQYRVSAWNLYGRSPYGVAACELEPAVMAVAAGVKVEAEAPVVVKAVSVSAPVPPPGYPVRQPVGAVSTAVVPALPVSEAAEADVAEAANGTECSSSSSGGDGSSLGVGVVMAPDNDSVSLGMCAKAKAALSMGSPGGGEAACVGGPPVGPAPGSDIQRCVVDLAPVGAGDTSWAPFLPSAVAAPDSACTRDTPARRHRLPNPYPAVAPHPHPNPGAHHDVHPHPHAVAHHHHGECQPGPPQQHLPPQPQPQQHADEDLMRLLLQHRHDGPSGPGAPPRFFQDGDQDAPGPSQPRSASAAVAAAAEPPERSATPHRWWTTMLLAVLPWLLRLLPLPVVRAVAEGAERVLAAAVRGAAAWMRRLRGLGAGSNGAEQEGVMAAATVAAAAAGAAAPPAVTWTRSGWFAEGAALRPCTADLAPYGPATGQGAETACAPGSDGGGDEGSRLGVVNIGHYPFGGARTVGGDDRLPGSPARGSAAAGALLSLALAGRPPLPPHLQTRPAGSSLDGSCSGEPITNGSGGSGRASGSGGPAAAAPVTGGRAMPPHRSGSEGDMYGLGCAGTTEPESQPGSPFFHQGQYHRQPTNILPQHHTSAPYHLTRHNLAGSAPALGLLSAAAAAGPGHHHQHLSHLRGGSLHGRRSGGGGGSGGPYDPDAEAAEAEALAAAIAAGKACAAPGCRRKLDLMHYRDYLRRHYCGRCQKYVCQAHTAFSPHGEKGSCDHVSSCVCVTCFAEFGPERQRALQKLNKLPQAVTLLGPSASSALHAGSPLTGAGPAGAGVSGATEGKSSAKQMWERAAVKLKAVTRFRGKRGGVPRTTMEPVVE